jgi:hypothetical protein
MDLDNEFDVDAATNEEVADFYNTCDLSPNEIPCDPHELRAGVWVLVDAGVGKVYWSNETGRWVPVVN